MSTENATIDLPPAETKAPIAGAKPAVELLKYSDRGVKLSSLEDGFRMAKAIRISGLAPASFKTDEAILIALQLGAEVGLPPMAALSSIAVINGRPCLYGDAMPGIVNASGLMEDYKQEMTGTIGSDDWGYKVTVKRKGRSEPVTASFTVEKAKKAGLWAKAGPWSAYPDRMLLARARTFALRDCFSDVLRGMTSAEEAGDTPSTERNVTGTGSLAALE